MCNAAYGPILTNRARRNRAHIIKTSTQMKADMDKDERRAYGLLMDKVNEIVPATDYMDAENRATMADRREREEWGESSGRLHDLRGMRDDVLSDAATLAHSLARLQRWMRDEPADGRSSGLMAVFDGLPNDLAALSTLSTKRADQ